MTTDLPIEPLTCADVPRNVALAQAVGWRDSEGDWRVLHDGAVVLGVEREARLIGQGALGLYGTAGTIAKMVVAPDVQRQQIGSRLLDALLSEADRRSIGVLGLVATPLGRPLYQSRSFGPVGEVIVLAGDPEPTNAASPALPLQDADEAPRVDEHWISCSRVNMLRARFREAIATSSVRGPGDRFRGYAMATAQGPLSVVGPIIAESEEDARILARALFRAPCRPVRIDVPAERRDFRQWLQRIGFREQGTRVEMARGTTQLPWQVPQRFALATQAWG